MSAPRASEAGHCAKMPQNAPKTAGIYAESDRFPCENTSQKN